MYGTHYIFSKPFFRFWVAVTFIIAWAASLVILLMPIWQGRQSLGMFWRYTLHGRDAVVKKTATDRKTLEGVEEQVKPAEADLAEKRVSES